MTANEAGQKPGQQAGQTAGQQAGNAAKPELTFSFGQSGANFGQPPAYAGQPAGGLAPDMRVKDISTAEFVTEVIDASRERPVLVDFWAPWCGPCKQLGPVLEKVVGERRGAVKLVTMNIDNHPEIAGRMGVQSIPAVVAFAAGKPKDAFMGNIPESDVRRFVDRLAGPAGPSQAEEMLKAAEQAAAEGALGQAAEFYSAVLQEEPENVRALAGIGTLYLTSGDPARARAMHDAIPDKLKKDTAAASLGAAIALAEQAAALGDAAGLVARIDANPRDFQARFDLALALNAKNRREEAASQLLEIVRMDRKWKEDAARAQLLQLFEAWGMADEATLSARRRLSAVLFS